MEEKRYPEVEEEEGIGPYTMEELNARIDEAEKFIAQAGKGDWSIHYQQTGEATV